jgi:hypothetical protein
MRRRVASCSSTALGLVVALVVGGTAAQDAPTGQAPSAAPVAPAASASDPATPPPSRWAADLDRLDEDVRLRLLAPSDPASHWVRGALDSTDIESQVTHFAAARTTMPQERLYLASLAAACLRPTQPVLPECDAVDRLADWARRDEDNGVPDILLADRARHRRQTDTMLAHLAEAAGKPRFDDYWARGTLVFWDYFKALPPAFDPAARAEAAMNYADAQDVAWPGALRAMCADPRSAANDALRAACASLGAALSERASSWLGRLTGITVAYRNSAASRQAEVEKARVGVNQRRARCDDQLHTRLDGLESADAARRSRAVAAADGWIRAQAQAGEVAACANLAGAGR